MRAKVYHVHQNTWFLTYDKMQGVPTPLFATDQEMLLCQIQQQNAYDDSLYVVVHSASIYLTLEMMKQEYVS